MILQKVVLHCLVNFYLYLYYFVFVFCICIIDTGLCDPSEGGLALSCKFLSPCTLLCPLSAALRGCRCDEEEKENNQNSGGVCFSA